MAFKALGLSDELIRGILASGYAAPTAIQERAIPIALTGSDLVACAQTGTGKTAAFVLPMLHRLSQGVTDQRRTRIVRALVLTPTRELAVQVEQFVKTYGKFMSMRSVSLYGGVGIAPQIDALRRGVDIVVATPGRLLDHLERRSVDLSHVEILVLDEADRMFDMGFINDVKAIIERTPAERQTMLISATMPNEVRRLAATSMRSPKTVEVGTRTDPAASVTQHVYRVQKEHKLELLQHILDTAELDNVLVFSRTKHGADKITRKLERSGVSAAAIHSNRTQAQRQRALDGFRNGVYKVLVATDIASRGIDVDGISHVINFDTPRHPEDYIHRVGRTGRANAAGDALTFVADDEVAFLRDIERFTGRRWEREAYKGFSPSTQPAAPAEAEPSERRPQQRERRSPQSAGRDRRPERQPSREPRGERQPASNGTPLLDGRSTDRRNDSTPRDRDPRRERPRQPGSSPQSSRRSSSAPYPARQGEGPRRSGPSTQSRRDDRGPRDQRGPAGPRRSDDTRSRRPGPNQARTPQRAPQAADARPSMEHSSLHLYSKTKPYKSSIPVSRFTGELFSKDDTFVHPLQKKKKFPWNPFKKTS